MKRADALALIRIAGYHDSQRDFMRLYTENRISLQSANAAYQAGIDSKSRGMKCSCYQCKAPTNGK